MSLIASSELAYLIGQIDFPFRICGTTNMRCTVLHKWFVLWHVRIVNYCAMKWHITYVLDTDMHVPGMVMQVWTTLRPNLPTSWHQALVPFRHRPTVYLIRLSTYKVPVVHAGTYIYSLHGKGQEGTHMEHEIMHSTWTVYTAHKGNILMFVAVHCYVHMVTILRERGLLSKGRSRQ